MEDAVQLMRNRDVTTYVISIGDRSDVPVQRPEDLFYVTSYSNLPYQVQSIARNITLPRGMAISDGFVNFYILLSGPLLNSRKSLPILTVNLTSIKR